MKTIINATTGEATTAPDDVVTPEQIAEAQAARLASFHQLIPKAAAFRSLLRAYFGANAETNRAVTAEVVAQYFLTAPDLTVQGVQHGMTLKELFTELSAWNGTGETWTLPWEVVP